MNEDIIERGIDISYPLNIQLPLPTDPRQFFTDITTAEEAAINAVAINIVKDGDGSYIGFTLPSSEEGGRDGVYYFGEPIVVLTDDKTVGDLYIIVKNPEGDGGVLQPVGNKGDYYTKGETDTKISEAIGNLDSDIITGFIFTQERNTCGELINLNGLYKKGLEEVDGILQLCGEKELVVQFDRTYPYTQSNPLATVKRVQVVSNKVDDTKAKVDDLEEEVANLKAGLASTFNIEMMDENENIVGEYQKIGDSITGLTFRITSSYQIYNKVDITCNGETKTYNKSPLEDTVNCVWGDVSTSSDFVIDIYCENKTVQENRRVTFVLSSFYGVMSVENYNNLKPLKLNYEGSSLIFKHVYDINGLDYVNCYYIYGIDNIEDITPLPDRYREEIRGYSSSFPTEAIGGLDVNERFFAIVPTPSNEVELKRYLCYVKDDPCRITELKQTFIP